MVTCARLPAAVGDSVVAVEPLRHGLGNAATGGICRVRGTAGSAVLKVARLPAAADPAKSFPTSDEPDHWNYWRREALAYQTGLAATAYAGAGIVAPALLEVNTRSDGGVELWLAEVAGTACWDWPVPRLARFAYELGAAHARWVGRVPDLPWLSRGWLAGYLAEGPPRLVRVADADWDHPSVAVWPAGVRRRLRQLWADPGRLTAIAGAAERSLCHLDVWPANLVDEDGTSLARRLTCGDVHMIFACAWFGTGGLAVGGPGALCSGDWALQRCWRVCCYRHRETNGTGKEVARALSCPAAWS